MKQFYAFAVAAKKDSELEVRVSSYVVFAADKEEADSSAAAWAHSHYPDSRGWSGHLMNGQLLPWKKIAEALYLVEDP